MECRECRKTFKTHFQCSVHKKVHMYKCKHCEKGFFSQKDLSEHEIKHNVEYGRFCKLCNLVVSAEKYDRHWKAHACNGTEKFECLTCNRSFAYLKSFQKHSIKCEEKPSDLRCDLCSAKPFKTKFGLEQHVRKHTSELSYTCDVCNKGFLRKVHLLVHMECHGMVLKDHPFQCEDCGAKFYNQYNLERHALRFHYIAKKSDEKYSSLIGLKIEILGDCQKQTK